MDNCTKKKVCVIGAGAAGLCALRHLARDSNFAPIAYEQTTGIGGTWVYNEKTGSDENNLPIHSSMYQNLRTNLPAIIMNFPDYMGMQTVQPCCVTHDEVLNYLRAYAEHFQIYQYIEFETKVESVRLNIIDGNEKWVVKVKRFKTCQDEEFVFDAVMICNGHYFDPYIPAIPGMETFPGTILHSHDYRKPEPFSGMNVLILGAAASGIDIGIDLANSASYIYLSHNNDRIPSILPSNMTQVYGVERVEGNRFFLRDGTSVTADAFIYCTGYRNTFPFLDESCDVRVDDNYVTPLYKHLINIEHPTMGILGIPSTVVPFPMFHMQVQYFLALLKETATLPSKADMLEDSKLKATKKRHAHKLHVHQWEYNDSLATAGGFDRLPSFYKTGYELWSELRKGNLLRYKDSKFALAADGIGIDLVAAN